MRLELRQLAPWVFGLGQLRRYTQDSPVMPDVWTAFGEDPDGRLDLLLEPHRDAGAGALALALNDTKLTPKKPVMKLAYNQSHVAAALTFGELVCGVLPLSKWWKQYLWPPETTDVAELLAARRDEIVAGLNNPQREQGRRTVRTELPGALIWFVGIVGRIEWERRNPDRAADDNEPPEGLTYELIVDTAAELLKGLQRDDGEPPKLWAVNRNRPARPAVWRSRVTVKADAAIRLFSLSCRTLCWAVLDSGIDATHPAFARRDPDGPLPAAGARAAADSRVRATYDFTRLRALLSTDAKNEINQRLLDGRPVDWTLLLPQLEITARPTSTRRRPTSTARTWPASSPATGARTPERPRTTGSRASARTSSSTTCACSTHDGRRRRVRGHGRPAVRPLAQLAQRLRRSIHGVNLSLSIPHDVANYACGRTPGLRRVRARRVGSGVVVVAAAGNQGYRKYTTEDGRRARATDSISITDPGNADGVITVGATHRFRPAHLRRQLFLQPRPDRRRPRQARPRRARREDHRAAAGRTARPQGRHEHGRAARQRRRRAADGAPQRAGRPPARGQARSSAPPPPTSAASATSRAPACSTSCARSSRCEAGMIFTLEALQAFDGDSLLLHVGDPPAVPDRRRAVPASSRRACSPRLEQLRAARADATLRDRPRDGQPHRRRPHPGPHRLRRRDGRARRRPPAPALRGRRAVAQRVRRRARQPRGASSPQAPGPVVASVGQGRELRDQAIRLGGRATSRSTGSWSRPATSPSATPR